MDIKNQIEAACQDRNSTIKAIRKALKERTGMTWSVKGGRGTAYGWIRISAPPARCGQFGYMSEQDRAILAGALGIENVHEQGESIPASSDYRRVYLARALTGSTLGYGASPYWD